MEGELVFPAVRDAVKVWVDDSYMGSAVLPPYRVAVNAAKGKHVISVQVANTLGNQLNIINAGVSGDNAPDDCP